MVGWLQVLAIRTGASDAGHSRVWHENPDVANGAFPSGFCFPHCSR